MSPSSPAKKKTTTTLIVAIVVTLVASLLLMNRFVDLPFEASSNSVYNPLSTTRKTQLQKNKKYKKSMKTINQKLRCLYKSDDSTCK